ncbi:hypothetical protein ACWC10_00355 [Streptomyces sp. NPDC001595]|uniref:hypothetical protein n=1 Tax=Streptomyces sp. NPDC001532 TaxID=3154520 RepID=UPI0033178215
MTNDNTRCARPTCAFSVEPQLTEIGTLAVAEFCSDACREWLVNAVDNARCEPSPAVERQARRLFLIHELLNLRDHPSDVVFYTLPADPLGAQDGC